MPGMSENLACPACQKIWHARHAGDFGTRGMLGINFLLEPRLLVALVGRSRNLKICLQGMEISVACQLEFQQGAFYDRNHLKEKGVHCRLCNNLIFKTNMLSAKM